MENEYGLTQCVQDVTHGHRILDKFFCSHPFVYRVTVFNSCLKTKHHAILAAGLLMQNTTSIRKKFVVFDLRDSNIDRLRYNLNMCSWDNVYNCLDINVKFQNFVNVILILMSQCIPARVVRLGKRDPSFVTPLVRILLNRRRRLRHRGHLTAANALAEKINHIISRVQSESLTDVTSQSTRKLWAAVNFKYRDTIPTKY